MSDTKLIQLKLKAPKLNHISEGILTAAEHGWKKHIKSHDFSPKVVVLQKEVPITSPWPSENVWNCRDPFPLEPMIVSQEVFDTLLKAIEDDSEIKDVDLSTTKDFSASGIVKISDNNTIQIDKDETVVDTLQTEVLDTVKFSRTPDGFEMRPYTLEDLAEIKWSDLTKLSAALGVSDGKRPERELAIVKASLEQWGGA